MGCVSNLVLNRSGDRFFLELATDCPQETRIILENAVDHCKTHRAVFDFFDTHRTDPKFDPKYVCFKHRHNFKYEKHHSSVGKYHVDKIEDIREFARLKALRAQTVHYYFDNAAHCLGRTFHFLNYYSTCFLIGSVPASLKVVLGAAQLTAGVAFSALALLPATFSSSARIALVRSFKHIGHGSFNMITAFFQAIPLIGSLISYSLISNSDYSDN